MLLKSLKLQNIRSYVEESITFPSGSCLLAGDIGAGKSTVLLAIEFALFGAKRGELEAGSLLRNGAHAGRVELCFDLNGNEVVVSRTLKRTPKSIKQNAGYIVSGNVRQDATSTELRAKIIDLLGYPKEALTKKDLLYRYTVFTPQEDMRKILYDDKEARLNTLRKVFQIDKYKRMKVNAQLLAKEMKSRRRVLEESVSGLLDLELQEKSLQQQILEIEKKCNEEKPLLIALQNGRVAVEKQISALDTSRKELQVLEQQKVAQETSLKQCVLFDEKVGFVIERLDQEIRTFQEKMVQPAIVVDTSALEKDISVLLESLKGKDIIENEMKKCQENILIVTEKLAMCEAKKSATQETIQRLSTLDSCSLCLQNVTHEHKQTIIGKQEEIYGVVSKNAALLLQEKKTLMNLLQQKRGILSKLIEDELKKNVLEKELLEKKHHVEKLVLEKKNMELLLEQKIKEKENKTKEKEEQRLQQNKHRETLQNIVEQMKRFVDLDVRYTALKKSLEEAFGVEREKEISIVSLEKEKEGVAQQCVMITKDIVAKKEIVVEMKKLKVYASWLQEFFVPLVSTMEKHVLLQVHASFNSFFTSWFAMLMDDDTMHSRLDEEFSPVIEQNGYETALLDLSGGEKTAVALAYRLALNKVINDFVTSIHTKSIIILDEPTDGFSAQQLDKVREVLDQIAMEQVIIVSHESKIESFVDSVLRIEKTGHVSRVLG
jgi:DNA repair protein SbcC/Rad50